MSQLSKIRIPAAFLLHSCCIQAAIDEFVQLAW
jgi:hypothetical protein